MRDYDGKTADERVAERRARLIDAGLELFGEHGYAGTSIRAVLRQSGLRDRYFGKAFPIWTRCWRRSTTNSSKKNSRAAAPPSMPRRAGPKGHAR